KIYQADAASHKATGFSKVAYVELIDHEGKPVLQAKIGLGADNGNGNGSLTLPAHLGSGNYLLRAYTQWMRNFDQAYFFKKAITVVNTSRRPDWQQLEKRSAYSIHFFPEGGNLVYALQSRVGFHITDQYGKGVQAEGVIVDQRNDTVARFQPGKFGIGSFYFQPIAGSNYKAMVRFADGTVVPANLPQIYERGYVVQLSEPGSNQLKVTISTTDVSASLPVYVLAHTRQQMKLAAMLHFNNGKAEWTIDKSSLGEGVSHLTVFNQQRQPVCERLYFKAPATRLQFDISTDKQQYDARSKVNVDVLPHNEKNQPVHADVSMSVFRIDSLQQAGHQSIETYFWLTSDLSGNVEYPDYYLKNNTEEARKAADDLMLTHGWRRFRWQDVTAVKQPAFQFLPEYEGLTINARIVDRRNGSPAPGVLSYVSFADERFQVSNAVSNDKGQAVFLAKNIYGPQELVIQADSNRNTYRIDLSDAFAPRPTALSLPRFTLPEMWKDQLSFHHVNTRIANSFRPESAQQYVPPITYDTTLFYGKPDKRYYLDDYTRFPTMEEVMREYVSEVRVRKERAGFHYEVMNIPAKLFFNEAPLVLLDGVPVFNVDKIIAFDPLKVKQIDVIGRKYFWGNLVTNGIVSYSTYEGDLAGFELDPAAVVMEFQGLQLQREFYQPDYTTPNKKASRVPDVRNVLYWKGDLDAGASGRLKAGFYTSDLPGTYIIIVQGLDDNGVPGTGMRLFTVSSPL
ncbi:MAG TPA: hypothetical protein VD996_17415, partial [Chitinophagaceae bacterium]|nr:hypothetical protein [Chitinophagaceae bacterium]